MHHHRHVTRRGQRRRTSTPCWVRATHLTDDSRGRPVPVARDQCEWVNGTHSRSTISGFSGLGQEHTHRQEYTIDSDHPAVFASADNAATPPEIVLAALGSCLTGGVASVATRRGVQLRSVTATIEGDMDLQGILGIDRDVRNGFDGISGELSTSMPMPRRPTSRRSWPNPRSARQCSTSSPTRRPSRSRSSERAHAYVPVAVIGAGQAGLAMSHHLSGREGSTTSSSSAVRWPTLGARNAGTRCGC